MVCFVPVLTGCFWGLEHLSTLGYLSKNTNAQSRQGGAFSEIREVCIRKSHAFDIGKVGKFTIVACWVMPKGVMLELRGRLKIMNSPFGLEE